MTTEENKALLRRAWDEIYGHGRLDSVEEFVLEDVIAEGEKVVGRYTVRGTHTGDTEEYGPPTGRQVVVEGITVYHFRAGKLAEMWDRYDNLVVLQQLGLMAEVEPAARR